MFTFILLFGLMCGVARADISHLTNGLFQQFHSLYGYPAAPAPPIISQPPLMEPFIPEIIVNRKLKDQQGYNYNPPTHNYLPPLGEYDPAPPPNQQYPQQFPDSQEDSQVPLNSGYLPVGFPADSSSSVQRDQGDFIISYDGIEKNQLGYDYNVPTVNPNPIIFPTPATGGDIPLDPVTESQPPVDQGYNYENPINQLPIKPPDSSYLPPVTFVRHAKDFDQFTGQPKSPIRLQLREMRCVNSQGGYLRAAFRLLDSSIGGSYPIVDSEIFDSRCALRLIQSHIVINIGAEDFQRCGVRNCDQNLCLRIRFPLIRGMKTGSDSVLTLQCKIQERIVAKLHSLKMGIGSSLQERSTGAYAQGGTQQQFRTHIELLRKSSNGFTQQVEPKGVVQLGEELMLRAHVNAADGWNHTKLTDVNLQRIAPSGEILNSANLVTSLGCINPSMKSICPIPPSFEPPLGHRLSFKAVMFQGMRSGEELVMSIKIAGCLEHADCFVNTQSCNNPPGISRLRRSLLQQQFNNITRNATEFAEISSISFRVEMPKIEIGNQRKFEETTTVFLVSGLGLMGCFITAVMVLIYLKFKY